MNGNFHFFEKIEVEVPPPHVFRCETQNAIADFSGCSWNFYILSKLGGSSFQYEVYMDSLGQVLTSSEKFIKLHYDVIEFFFIFFSNLYFS